MVTLQWGDELPAPLAAAITHVSARYCTAQVAAAAYQILGLVLLSGPFEVTTLGLDTIVF